jgi:hypothetical protein
MLIFRHWFRYVASKTKCHAALSFHHANKFGYLLLRFACLLHTQGKLRIFRHQEREQPIIGRTGGAIVSSSEGIVISLHRV